MFNINSYKKRKHLSFSQNLIFYHVCYLLCPFSSQPFCPWFCTHKQAPVLYSGHIKSQHTNVRYYTLRCVPELWESLQHFFKIRQNHSTQCSRCKQLCCEALNNIPCSLFLLSKQWRLWCKQHIITYTAFHYLTTNPPHPSQNTEFITLSCS